MFRLLERRFLRATLGIFNLTIAANSSPALDQDRPVYNLIFSGEIINLYFISIANKIISIVIELTFIALPTNVDYKYSTEVCMK